MGNVLEGLRVGPPTPEEDERNHPLYYDWSVPKWTPFKRDQQQQQQQPTTTQPCSQLSQAKDSPSAKSEQLAGKSVKLPTSASTAKHERKSRGQEEFKSKLTVDSSSKRPANLSGKSKDATKRQSAAADIEEDAVAIKAATNIHNNNGRPQ